MHRARRVSPPPVNKYATHLSRSLADTQITVSCQPIARRGSGRCPASSASLELVIKGSILGAGRLTRHQAWPGTCGTAWPRRSSSRGTRHRPHRPRLHFTTKTSMMMIMMVDYHLVLLCVTEYMHYWWVLLSIQHENVPNLIVGIFKLYKQWLIFRSFWRYTRSL